MSTEAKTHGQIAYETYGEFSGWKSLANGKPIPHWPEVADKIKEAWELVGKKLVEMTNPHLVEFKVGAHLAFNGEPLPDEASENARGGRDLVENCRTKFTGDYAVGVIERIRKELPDIAPSAGHDHVDEVLGLLRVARGREQAAEEQWQVAKDKATQVAVERDEILARIMNALGLKGGELADILKSIADLQNAKPVVGELAHTDKFPEGQLSFKRTGRLIEFRLAETGEAENELLAKVTDGLKALGLEER